MGSGRSLSLVLVALGAACGPVDVTLPDPTALSGPGPFLISNSVETAGFVTGAGLAAAPAGGSGLVAYVSLPPGTLPLGSLARIRVERTGELMSAALYEGGLDPVAIPAVPGDTISLAVDQSGGGSLTFRFTVEIRKPPILVRTKPARNKRDVPLNLRLEVVFSEPIDPGSLTPENFELRLAGNRVQTELGFTNPSHTIVELTPVAELAAAADYELVLGPGIHDTDGEALAPDRIPFTTVNPALSVYAFIGEDGIYLINSDGTGLRRLRPLKPFETILTLAWSPDRQRLAFGIDYDDGNTPAAIHIMNADGSNEVRFTDVGSIHAPSHQPAWSPDGTEIVYSAYFHEGGQNLASFSLYSRSVNDGSERLLLAHSPGLRFIMPAWSPDGRRVTFSTTGGSPAQGQGHLYVMEADDPVVRPLLLAPTGTWYRESAWSPDGLKLAVRVCVTLTPDPVTYRCAIAVMNVDGSAYREIAPSDESEWRRHLTWAPDSQALVFAGPSGVQLVRVAP